MLKLETWSPQSTHRPHQPS